MSLAWLSGDALEWQNLRGFVWARLSGGHLAPTGVRSCRKELKKNQPHPKSCPCLP